jgi:hypothetical protein
LTGVSNQQRWISWQVVAGKRNFNVLLPGNRQTNLGWNPLNPLVIRTNVRSELRVQRPPGKA